MNKMYLDLEKRMIKIESSYSKYATLDKESIRLKKETKDFRPNFFRDADRIIHSSCYTRYMGKTQVFSNSLDDLISKRMVHVQLVAKIGRTIGRALNLNEDLIEAIALGHDLGHVPYGHVGEKILDKICQEEHIGRFHHNVQSVRNMMVLEDTNLSLQVLDGMLCHNGELELQKYEPVVKTKQQFLKQVSDLEKGCNKDKIIPMTLEGCVVRVSDIISYLGRDIEDACELGVLSKKDIPKEITDVLGNSNRTIVNTLICDILENSYDKTYLCMSNKVFKSMKALKQFNYKYIYDKANTKEQIANYEKMFRCLFDSYYKDLKEKRKSPIFDVFLDKQSDEYKKTDLKKIVIDFIAGMTDRYFNLEYERINNR